MSDYEEEFDEDFDDDDDQNDEDNDDVDQDEFETCGYCGGAGSVISLLGHRHGTCDYCFGMGMMPTQNN